MAIREPPWRIPPAVQRSSAHGIVPITSSGWAAVICMPHLVAKGIRAARSARVGSVMAVIFGQMRAAGRLPDG